MWWMLEGMLYLCWLILLCGLNVEILARSVPSFCVDDEVMQLFHGRIEHCLRGASPNAELQRLRVSSVAHYQSAQELVAYQYFTDEKNPHRRSCSDGADLEYVPVLPLAWKVGFPTHTSCTAGGVCPRHALSHRYCDIKYLIDDILRYVKYVRDKRNRKKGGDTNSALPFMVTGALNVKTILGHGMPTQIRRGSAWNDVMWFVERTYLGHFERLPQCADLLRKPWKHIVEVPYIPLLPAAGVEIELSMDKDLDFVFVGRIHLWGISRACAVRPWLARQPAERPRTELFEITENLTYGPPLLDSHMHSAMRRSAFCLITRADSYSTSSFYNAIQFGCIPVVISDWFVFSFWWAIPYEKFVIRISEELFMSNPNEVLDRLLRIYNKEKIFKMQQEMKNWRSSLQYENVANNISPLNLLMTEITDASKELITPNIEKNERSKGDINNVLSCFDPIFCASRKGPKPLTFPGPKIKNVLPYLCQHAPRLLGRYKIVYFQKCVKLLWPLRPGNVLKKDRSQKLGGITPEEEAFVRLFHNLSIKANVPTPSATLSLPWKLYPSVSRNASNYYTVKASHL